MSGRSRDRFRDGGGQTFTAAGAWVIVAPPKFAPPIDNVFRYWDMLFDVFVKAGQLQVPATPSYANDIYPILRALRTRWRSIPTPSAITPSHIRWQGRRGSPTGSPRPDPATCPSWSPRRTMACMI